MNEKYFKVEFDPAFHGGDYSGVGNYALVPEQLVTDIGMADAFETITGHVATNIIHYSEDDRFNVLGEQFRVELPADQPVQLPEPMTVDIDPGQPVDTSAE